VKYFADYDSVNVFDVIEVKSCYVAVLTCTVVGSTVKLLCCRADMYSGGEYSEAAASQAYQQQQQQLYEQQQTQQTQQFDLTQQQTLASYDQTGQYDQPPTPVNMVTRVRVTRARVRAAAAAAAPPQPPGLCTYAITLVSSVACLPEVR
jgi:transcription initiation factor TFIID subunit TAF12